MTDFLCYTSLEGVEMKFLRITRKESPESPQAYKITSELPANYKQRVTTSDEFYRQVFKDSVKPTKGDTSSVRFSNGQYLTCLAFLVKEFQGRLRVEFGLNSVNDKPPQDYVTRFVEYYWSDPSGAFWDTAARSGAEPTAYLACDQHGNAGCITALQPDTFFEFDDSAAFNVNDFFSGVTPDPPVPPSGDHCELSTTGGGNGTCSTAGGDLDFHSLPQISAVDLGMVTLYKPTLAQLQEFSSYLWSDSFVVDSLKKMFADPMDVILAVQQFPVSPPDGVDRTVTVGDVSTGIKMTTLPEQYYDLVLDPIRIEPYWDNFLDYAPYTTLTLHLPFIGDRSINPADVMGKVLQVRYIFDMLTGTCLAQILCGDTPTGGTGKHVLYEFAGTCSAQIPIHSRDWGRAISNAISVVGGAATTLASAVTGDAAGAAQGAGGILGTVGSMVSGGMGPQIGRAGGISGSPGLMANRQVYLIRQQPRQSLPSGYGKLYGWPSNITSKLGDLTGYTVVDKIHLDGIPATSTERDEIEALLKGGVIL